MEKKKNGCKAFLISRNRILRSVVTLLLLVSFLFLDVVRVAAASTLEEEAEISDNSQSGLNITDDDYANGNLLYGISFSYNNDMVRKSFITAHTEAYTNGITSAFSWAIDSVSNVEINRTEMMRLRYSFALADGTKMMSKGSDFTLSLSGLFNGVSVFDVGDAFVVSDYLGCSASSDSFQVRISLNDIDGKNLGVIEVPLTRVNLGYKELSFDFDFEDLPYDVYSFVVSVTFKPYIALPDAAPFIGSENYKLVFDVGLVDSSFSITEFLYDETSEQLEKTNAILDAINDNLDDIWARLVAIYDMVEQGFSAIVTLFYDLMDFLADEFDDLSQTIVTQAGETRNAIVTQFTNLTNKLSAWFTNLTDTITAQFANLITNLSNWFTSLYQLIGKGFDAVENYLFSILKDINAYFSDLFDKMDENHDSVVNGYDNTYGTKDNEQVKESIVYYNASQGVIMDSANDNMDEYTLPSDGLIGYAMQFTTTFPLVASMMQSVFDSSGQFGLILSVIFAMTIFAMVIGLYKYYND